MAETAATDQRPAGDGQQGATAGTDTQTQQTGQTASTGQQPPTVLDGGDKGGQTGDTATAATTPTWPEDWRTRLSKGDDKIAKRLERYTTPEAIADALIASQDKIRSGEVKSALPSNATAEQLAEWRKDNGIPEKPDDYIASLPQGLVINDADKKMIGDFFAAAHAKNASPAVVGAMVDWYYKNHEAIEAEQRAQDEQYVAQAEDAMRASYGADYRTNKTGLEHLFGRDAKDGSFKGSFFMPEEVANALATARTGDGRPLLADPKAIDWFVSVTRELHPELFRTIAPSGSGNPGAGLDQRIKEIEQVMREDRKRYNREGLDKEYRELVAARDRQNKRNAA